MFKWPWQRSHIRYEKREKDIDPDEIFIDSENLPNFDVYQFEGRLEKPISRRSLFSLGVVVLIIILVFIFSLVVGVVMLGNSLGMLQNLMIH